MRLSRHEARRLLLWNQRLTGNWGDPIDIIRHLVAVQTQYSQSLPSVLAARASMRDFGWIERELLPAGCLIKSWTVRHTLHTMVESKFELLRTALEKESYEAFLSWCIRAHGEAPDAVEDRNRRILEALSEGPLTRAQLHQRIPEFKEMAWTGWGADVKGLAILGHLAMCSHRGETTFFRREPISLGLTAREARAEVLRHYLRTYGPASKADFGYWYGGYVGPVNEAWADVLPEMVPVEVDGRNGLYVLADCPDVGDLPNIPKVRFLAKFDTLLLGHKDKSLYLRPELQGRVFRKAGQIEAAIMVRGEIEGTWRAKQISRMVEFSIERWPEKWSASIAAALDGEAARQARAFGQRDFTIHFVS